jgi:hypothetical protein
MPEIAPRAELMRSLGRLVRGLSALFWGLPLTLVTCVYVATTEWTKPMHMMATVFMTGLLYYGLNQLGSFQKQERIWHDSLERAKVIAMVNVGLSPFIYWYNRMPNVSFYELALFFLTIMGLVFLFTLNHVLQRLAAMLPDETLRIETRVFGNLNIALLSAIVLLFLFFFILSQFPNLPDFLTRTLRIFQSPHIRYGILVFLILLPLAMTMTLIWKIKEVIFASVFSHES